MKILNEVISNLETYRGVEYINREELIKSLKLAKEELTKQLNLSGVSCSCADKEKQAYEKGWEDGAKVAADDVSNRM